ncbi:hypothetical protein QTG54_002989 [Skeletonema marinoi]|uniref:Uncharacterized protein n=1 Tax=Skeletonema marinoi TaxID=267567 RepID=A0AAD9DGI8_9STRA|nr:hypothetical protein QTG54_002989 [Skeletonema marinoi]
MKLCLLVAAAAMAVIPVGVSATNPPVAADSLDSSFPETKNKNLRGAVYSESDIQDVYRCNAIGWDYCGSYYKCWSGGSGEDCPKYIIPICCGPSNCEHTSLHDRRCHGCCP